LLERFDFFADISSIDCSSAIAVGRKLLKADVWKLIFTSIVKRKIMSTVAFADAKDISALFGRTGAICYV